MYFLKVTYDILTNECTVIPIDGEYHKIASGLSASAKDNGNGRFNIQTLSWERKNPNDENCIKNEICKSHTLKVGEKCEDSYSVTEWSYIKGVYYTHPSYFVEIIDGITALNQSDDSFIKAQVHLSLGEYERVDELLNPILLPDKNHYYFVNSNANKLQAKRYELGLGVEKNLNKAYVHYLFANSYADVIRLMDMGYGKGVLEDDYRKIDWNEYYALKLLYAVGEKEYAEYKIYWNAGCWTYSSNQKQEKSNDNAKWNKTVALCRKQACEWMMDKNSLTVSEIEKLTLFSGAYLSYLKQGHEGACSYVSENFEDGCKSNQTSVLSAKGYINEAVEKGNEFAIRIKSFIDVVKESER